MNTLLKMVSKDQTVSSMRIATLTSVFTILGVFIAHNVMSILKLGSYSSGNGGFIDFPANSVMIILIALGAKLGQHVSENHIINNNNNNQNTPITQTSGQTTTQVTQLNAAQIKADLQALK